ncbi:hypothetical protein TNCV_2452051 [Trichonephila clavipes]|nr:hypothetical protein TNCV_2452051 [Trichonephila clavipes]
MDAVKKHDCSKRMEASSDMDVVNGRTFYSSFEKENRKLITIEFAELVICPECHEKLKDMDAVMKQDCAEKKEVSFDEDRVNRKKFYSSFEKEQETDNNQIGFTGTPAELVICPECHEKLKDMDAVIWHGCNMNGKMYEFY